MQHRAKIIGLFS